MKIGDIRQNFEMSCQPTVNVITDHNASHRTQASVRRLRQEKKNSSEEGDVDITISLHINYVYCAEFLWEIRSSLFTSHISNSIHT